MNSFSVNWFKDDVRITKSYNDVIDDGRYSVQLEVASQEKILSRLQITGISDEDEGTFTCELTDSNNKRRQSISILIDDRDDTTSTDNRHYDKSNKAAYGNTTDQAVIDYENVTYITVAMEDITDDITDITDITTAGVSITQESNTTYEQTTTYQIETATRPGQVYNDIIIGTCVAVVIIVAASILIARKMFRLRKERISLNHPGPDYPRPRSSRFEPVSIEMNQPLSARGTADGYETIDKSKTTGQKKRNYEQATDDTFLNEYRTGGNGTSDGSENIRKSKNTDPLTGRDEKTRKHPYEKWNKDFLDEFL